MLKPYFDNNPEERKKDRLLILRIALISGIVILAMMDKDGWGWLTLILALTF